MNYEPQPSEILTEITSNNQKFLDTWEIRLPDDEYPIKALEKALKTLIGDHISIGDDIDSNQITISNSKHITTSKCKRIVGRTFNGNIAIFTIENNIFNILIIAANNDFKEFYQNSIVTTIQEKLQDPSITMNYVFTINYKYISISELIQQIIPETTGITVNVCNFQKVGFKNTILIRTSVYLGKTLLTIRELPLNSFTSGDIKIRIKEHIQLTIDFINLIHNHKENVSTLLNIIDIIKYQLYVPINIDDSVNNFNTLKQFILFCSNINPQNNFNEYLNMMYQTYWEYFKKFYNNICQQCKLLNFNSLSAKKQRKMYSKYGITLSNTINRTIDIKIFGSIIPTSFESFFAFVLLIGYVSDIKEFISEIEKNYLIRL